MNFISCAWNKYLQTKLHFFFLSSDSIGSRFCIYSLKISFLVVSTGNRTFKITFGCTKKSALSDFLVKGSWWYQPPTVYSEQNRNLSNSRYKKAVCTSSTVVAYSSSKLLQFVRTRGSRLTITSALKVKFKIVTLS